MLKIENSMSLFERAKQVIPSVTQTFSKGFTQFSFKVSPIFLERADGAHVWDVDGNKFIDCPGALGPIILGHNYPSVVEAVSRQIRNGVAFSLPHRKEVEVAEKLREIIPHAEMTRFGKNGSDATSGAVRAARAYTGKDIIACCGYHGWQDWYIGTTLRNKGVPKEVSDLTKPFPYNDINALQKIFDENKNQVACVILEPYGVVEPKDGFLQKVVDLAHKNNAIVIFDECWTGFRLSLSGAAGYFGVQPDISCFGKAMGNGFPISAVVGRKEFMQIFDEIFFSFTFGGDMVGLTAAEAVMSEMQTKPVLKEVWRLGKKLSDGVHQITVKNNLQKHIQLNGLPARTIFSIIDTQGQDWWLLKSFIQQHMHERGILFGGYHVINYSYTDALVDQMLTTYDEVFQVVATAIQEKNMESQFRGQLVQPVFRKP